MTLTSDNFSIYFTLVCTCLSLLAYLATAFKRLESNSSLLSFARGMYYAAFAALMYSSIYLMQQILSLARYDISYIYNYSGPKDELIYRVSAFWAGQEGSMLLWTLITGAIGLSLMRSRKSAGVLMTFWCGVQVFFLMLLVLADPFAKLTGYQPGMLGAGLNPLLKNPWMAIHPPIVFIGYAALIVPAAMAVQALLGGDIRKWVTRCLPWALFGWVSLSVGLILGMVWSYEVLGWGGYWGWDPVENASLIPWITSTMLVHGLLMQKYGSRMTRANVLLAFGTFLLIIYATFLTRSGILAEVSVHSFSDLGAYGYLLGCLVFCGVFCLAIVALRWKSLSDKAPKPMALFSKEFAVSAGVIVLLLFAGVVLVGTSYPLFTKASVGPEFFNRMSIPVAAAVVLLIMLSWCVGWRGSRQAGLVRFSRNRFPSDLAHIGVILLILGVALSINGKSETIALTENGAAKSALGTGFTYAGREKLSADSEIIKLNAERNGLKRKIPLRVDYSQRGAVRKPFVMSSIKGDIYVSTKDIEGTTVTPTASMTDGKWLSVPVNVPGAQGQMSLVAMQVESESAMVQYTMPEKKPIEATISNGNPATLDGYAFAFQRFVSNGTGEQMMGMTVGVELSVTGRDLAERAIIDVSWKPFIWVLWLGTALIALGGSLATWRRFRESRVSKDGILSDSD